jgi:predicted AlkP superfamily phosphohydrolase/phosphomutase
MLPRRPRLALAVLAAAAALLPARAFAWGFTAHRLVNEKAVETLPEPLRSFFQANAAYVTEHAVDPDLWRAVGQDPEPNHFLDMDAFGPPSARAIPRDEAEHLRKHGPDAAAEGRLPWRVGEVYRELVTAFRDRDPARILERAAVLGHYVGDAHVPLHAALNYDGQLTGQTGFHNRWESHMVERFERQLRAEVIPRPAHAVGDPVQLTLDVLTESFDLSLQALASDKESTEGTDLADTPLDDRYGDAYYSRLYERERGTLRSRLAASASLLGSLWLTAWQEAGRPPLDTAFRFPYVRGQARAVLMTLDGAGAGAIADAVARGVMPRLGRLRAAGATADGSLTSLPVKTAPGHAAIFTGTWGDRSGITGNRVSVPGARVTEEDTGYTTTHLRAEPIWVTAAREGLEASVVSAPQIYPFAPYQKERRFGGNFDRDLTLIEGYQNYEVVDAVYTAADLNPRPASGWLHDLPAHEGEAREIELTVAGTRVDGLFYDDPADAVRGLDTLYLGLDKDTQGGITLKPASVRGLDASAFSGLTVRVGDTNAAAYFRLFTLAPDGAQILLYRATLHPLRASKPRIEGPAFDATGGFVGGWSSRGYEEGGFGPQLWKGGDGTAERRYLEVVALTIRQFTRLTDFAMDRTPWDLLVTYLPYPDGALHSWLGYLDPSLPGHDPGLARRLQPLLDEVLAGADAFVGHVVDHAGPETIVAVAADHGMGGVDRVLKPNVALKQAGLLAVDPAGHIDLARTRAVYFPGNSAYFLINRIDREGGIVKPEDEETVRRDVASAMQAIRDPRTGRAVVTTVIDPREAKSKDPGIGGPEGGDLYLALLPGYDLSADAGGEVVGPIAPKGVHFLNPERPEMMASFVVAGPGVAAGAKLRPIRQIDIAPTLCALLGISPPAQATGKVLLEALARAPLAAAATAR